MRGTNSNNICRENDVVNEHEYIRKALSGLHASENTLEEVMKKAGGRNRLSKFCYVRKSVLIAALFIILCFTVACAAAVIKWGGICFYRMA